MKCDSCGKTVSFWTARSIGGKNYCGPCATRPELEAASQTQAPIEPLVVTDIRVPFSTVFTVVSQVLAAIAIWSLAAWALVACVRMVLAK
jgi:hypothetical protein